MPLSDDDLKITGTETPNWKLYYISKSLRDCVEAKKEILQNQKIAQFLKGREGVITYEKDCNMIKEVLKDPKFVQHMKDEIDDSVDLILKFKDAKDAKLIESTYRKRIEAYQTLLLLIGESLENIED